MLKRAVKQFFLATLVFGYCFQGLFLYAQNTAPVPAHEKPVVLSAEPVPSPASPTPKPTTGPQASYLVGPDDEIRMTVFGEKDLTGVFTISSNGLLSIPLIGDVPAHGKTLKQIEQDIIVKLKDGYLINPSVALEISKYRPFYILGEVSAPGSYGYVNHMNILSAVALAGGFTYRANTKYVQVRRVGPDQTEVLEEKPVDSAVSPGDIILVKERFF